MPMKIAGQAGRYLQTYWLLLVDLAADRGWRFAALLLLVCLAAVVHPLPFVLIGSLFLSAAGGARSFDLDLGVFRLSMALDDALPGIVLFSAAVFLFNYVVGRLVIRETLRWQSRLLWRLAAEVPRIARPDRLVDIGGAPTARNLGRRMYQAVRSGFLIGRLVDIGLRDAIVVLVTLAIMLVLDPGAVAAIAGVTLLFLPGYARLLLGLATERNRHLGRLGQFQRALADLLRRGLGARPGEALAIAELGEPALSASAFLVGFQSEQMSRVYGMTFLAGLHVLAGLTAVYYVEGGTFSALSPLHLSLFIVLLLMLRSVLGLAGLMSRLTRGYQGLALLRTFLRPRQKPLPARDKATAEGWRLDVAGSGGASHVLSPGSVLLLAAPQLDCSIDLVPLCNALVPLARSGQAATAHVPLLLHGAVDALRAGRIAPEAVSPLLLGDGPRAAPLAMRADPVDLSVTPVLALGAAAYAQIAAAGLLDAARKGRLLVVAAGDLAHPSPTSDTLLAISDGSRIIAAGPPAETASAFEADLRRWRRKAARQSHPEEDDAEDDDL